MNFQKKDYNYGNFRNQGTGGYDLPDDYKIIIYPFDKYEIKIKLTPSNEFIGIIEIKVNKEFLSHKQKITSKGFHDVDEFYLEEEE